MSRQLGQLAGAVAGTLIGGTWGAAITLASGLLFSPRQPGQSQDVGRLSDFQHLLEENSSYGVPIAEFGGKMQAAGTIIDCRYVGGVAAGIEEIAVTTQTGGGKQWTGRRGGGSAGSAPSRTTTYYYFISAAWMWGRSIDGSPLYLDKLELEDDAGRHVLYDSAGLTDRAKGFVLEEQLDELSDPCGVVGTDAYGAGAGLHHWYGTETQPVDSYLEAWHGSGNVSAYRGVSYTVLYHQRLRYGYRGLWATLRSATSGKSALVQARLDRAGIPVRRTHITVLQGDVEGIAVTQREPASTLIERICTLGLCNLTSVDGLIVDRSRANPLIHSIDEKWLGAHVVTDGRDDPESAPPPLLVRPVKETELPSELHIPFQDTNLRYGLNTAIAKRESATHENVVTVDLGAVAGNLTDMTRHAKLLLDEFWMGQRTYETQLLPACMRLAPGDVATVADTTGETPQAVQFLVGEQEIAPDGILVCRGPRYDGGVYGQWQEVDQNVLPPAEVDLFPPPETLVYDYVPLSDVMAEETGVLVAATTDGSWAEATLVSDENSGFGSAVIADRATMGFTADDYTFTEEDTYHFDYDTILTINLTFGQLASAPDEDTLKTSQANVLLIGDEVTGWTVLQFVEATQIDSNTWDIKSLLPGLKGSDSSGVFSFASGSKVLLLRDETGARVPGPVWVPVPSRLMGSTIDYEVWPGGNPSSDPATQSLDFVGNSMKPLSPTYVRADRSVAGETTIAWNPRTRYEVGASPSMTRDSDPDNYRLILSDGVTNKTVEVTGSREYVLTDAQATAWWGFVPDTLQGAVYQRNGTVGLGWPELFSGV